MPENEKEEHELEKIRMQKLKMMMEKQKIQEFQTQQQKQVHDKVNLVLEAVMSPDAYIYFNNLKNSDPKVYWAIYYTLITPNVIESIDLLLLSIKDRNAITRKLPLELIVYLERKFKGTKTSIKVKRKDEEEVDLSSFLI